jgi:hypothetical protein
MEEYAKHDRSLKAGGKRSWFNDIVTIPYYVVSKVIFRVSVILFEVELQKNFPPTCASTKALRTFAHELRLQSLKKIFTDRPEYKVSKN